MLDLGEVLGLVATGTPGAAVLGWLGRVAVGAAVGVFAVVVVFGVAEAVDVAANVERGVRLGRVVGVEPVEGVDPMADAQTAFSAVATGAGADDSGATFVVRSTPGAGTAAVPVRR